MISISPPSTVLITDAETSSRINPLNRALGTGDPATAAFQASFVRKRNVILSQDVTFCRAGVEAGGEVTVFA
jgi:hypothetical protein